MRKKKSFYTNRKWRLPIRLVAMTVVIVVGALVGMLWIRNDVERVTKDYNEVITRDYSNLEHVASIGEGFYRHQAMLFRYMALARQDQKRIALEGAASQLRQRIEAEERELNESVIGTDYEANYHEVYSGLSSYFDNARLIFSFISKKDYETADYYMNNQLEMDIQKVNESVDSFDERITRDVNQAQRQMQRKMTIIGRNSVLLVITLGILSTVIVAFCMIISGDIANKDDLTGVDNFEKFQADMVRLERKGKLSDYSCIICNLKDFTLVNQRMGSMAGDQVLRAFSVTTQKQLAGGERISRISGDRYAFLLKKERVEDFISFLDHIVVRIHTDGGTVPIQLECRLGICNIDEGDVTTEITDKANIALNQAKHSSSPDIVWYRQEMLRQVSDRREILSQYQNGLREKEFLVYYQPKVDISCNRLQGCEALVRWKKDSGIIPPFKFIPLLEEEGRIIELDFYVFEQMCRDLRDWLDRGIMPVKISSNFSKLHLRNPSFAETILEIAGRYQIEGELIEVELTESSGYEDFDALMRFSAIMREHGISVSMDDFGTGYSSLSLLKKLEVDVVKLDKTFIDGIGVNDIKNEDFVKNVIYMLKDLNRQIICEGVENESQIEFLKKQKCYMVQGYYYDKPLSHDEFENRLLKPVYEKYLAGKEGSA